MRTGIDHGETYIVRHARATQLPGLVLLANRRDAVRVLARTSAARPCPFPLNHYELELLIERAVGEASDLRVKLADLPPLPRGTSSLGSFLDRERDILRRALERAGGNRTRAARAGAQAHDVAREAAPAGHRREAQRHRALEGSSILAGACA